MATPPLSPNLAKPEPEHTHTAQPALWPCACVVAGGAMSEKRPSVTSSRDATPVKPPKEAEPEEEPIKEEEAEKEEAKTEEAAATKGEGEDGGADKKEGDEKDGEEKKEEKPLESLEEVLKNIPDVAPATGAGASVPRGKTKAPWGWKLDPDSTSGGFIRDSEQSEEHRPRKGMWCKIVDLTEAAHLNGRFCEITHLCEGEEREKTHCQIELDDDKFMIQQKNLNPLPGASERATFHMRWLPMVVLWVNGINCEGCKTSLIGALKGIEDVGDIRAESAVESGHHPNWVKVKQAKPEAVRNAIENLDAGRNKFTIVDKPPPAD